MDYVLKYIFYFLLGFIIYKIINYKVEGFNELTLLFSVLKDREDIGCSNYHCDKHGKIWTRKMYKKDESYFLCNNLKKIQFLN